MRVDFTKCHGSGNDFPLIDARAAPADMPWPVIARALADRAGPVGGDGLLLLTAGDETHAFGMRMFNSDGSEAETCLNGLRCVARAGFEATGLDAVAVRLATSSAQVSRDPDLAPGVVTIREVAGPASRDVARWPLASDHAEIVEKPIPQLGSPRAFTALAIPNPHLITFVDAIDEAELVRIGELCEAAPGWLPNRANVSFVELLEGGIYVRTFERGVGLTDSCGSAMAASTFAAGLTFRRPFGQQITVFNRGGLVRAQAESDGMVRLSGNATYEWAGSAEIDIATAVASDLTIARRFDAEVAAWATLLETIAQP
ncbi:diaminopimelate epimerase [Sphingomonas immobilis]|uniref:Diaminopimelate epimerase n=1 Tax=Sphingomonas immobilis TaxID=3063997 RepID=A0ABT9A382_9SPHN|nr:diaminopimelate epimerase [Sphingomonas sp. CA1-15]MDO7843665.1 diaminopimelate epimerase [Sphingomonas sp. CA1-15]